MSQTKTQWTLASVALIDAWTDFMLSRQAMQCSPATLQFYKHTAGAFLRWIEGQGVTSPAEVDARHVRQYLAELQGKDTTIHDHARAVKTLLRFWHAEGYILQAVTFEMPRLTKKRLPVLTVDELRQVVAACQSARDHALVLVMADSGLRRAEVCALDWDDLDFENGLIRVKRGKGGKARAAVIGVNARRALLAYRRTLTDHTGPMFQAWKGRRLTRWGLGLIFSRLSKRSGIHVTAHALRRTFTILSLRAGMDSLHLQALGGWSDLTMVNYYAQLEEIDLVEAHAKHSPIDNLRL